MNEDGTTYDDSSNTDVEDVVLLPSKMVINISSSDALQMSMTKGCLEVLTNLGKVSRCYCLLLEWVKGGGMGRVGWNGNC